MVINEKHTFGYTCVTSIIAIFIFIYSSSPKLMKFSKDDDFSDNMKDIRIEPMRYHPHVENLVLFIVDEFEVEDLNDSNLPYITKLIKDGTGCFSNYKLQPFSTTAQKIKTLVTGSPTGFLNNILSVNDEFSAEDTIFNSAINKKGLKILFHSWNTNFTFSNYYNIDKSGIYEYFLNRQFGTKTEYDWLIIHFHVLKSTRIPKRYMKAVKSINLRYIDDLIKSLHLSFSLPDNRKYKILIMGYSGTRLLLNDYVKNKNLGPLVMIQKESCVIQDYRKDLQEFDITPMLSVWTGLPIPSSSYGVLDANYLFDFTLSKKIDAFYYNTQKLYHNLLNLKVTKYINSLIPIFQKTVTNHREYLQNGEKNVTEGEIILKTYENLMNSFSKIINDLRIQKNASIQLLVFILLIEALVLILNTSCTSLRNLKNFAYAFGIHVILVVFILSLGTLRRVTSFISMSKEEAIMLAIIGIIMICNCFILTKQKSFLSTFFSILIAKARKSKETLRTLSSTVDLPTDAKRNSIFMAVLFGTICQSVSLLENNFNKYEKNIWSFLWASICFWMIIKKMKLMKENAFSVVRIDGGEKFEECGKRISIIIGSLLFMVRIISVYTKIEFLLQHSQVGASLLFLFGLIILAFVCKILYEPFSNKWEKITISLYLVFTVCAIYTLKVAEGMVTFYFFSISSTGRIELQLIWSGYCFGLLYSLVVFTMKTCVGRKSSAIKLIVSIIVCCSMFMACQKSVHNSILIPMQILYNLAVIEVLKKDKKSLILLHVWLGHLFYNYQKNYILNADDIEEIIQNLFSSDFNLIINGLISVVNQFSPMLLTYFLCIFGQLSNNQRFSESVLKINKTFMSCQLMIIIFYALGMMFRSPNEWSWTFLYLKFLYEVIYIILLILISLGLQTVASLHDIIVTPSSSFSPDIV